MIVQEASSVQMTRGSKINVGGYHNKMDYSRNVLEHPKTRLSALWMSKDGDYSMDQAVGGPAL